MSDKLRYTSLPQDYQNIPPVQTKEQWNEYKYKTNLCLNLRYCVLWRNISHHCISQSDCIITVMLDRKDNLFFDIL